VAQAAEAPVPATPQDESADDVQDATNTDTPWVDQSQTYTSHSSHQVFLREYVNTPGPDGVLNNNLIGVPLPVVVNRDRWQETEANSGAGFNDVIRGDDAVPSAVGGAGFTGCDAVDQTGINRIAGLSALVPASILINKVAASEPGVTCPLVGPIWGEGNILLGGAGSDTITGRGGDDLIDGDRYLNVRIAGYQVQVRTGATVVRTVGLAGTATNTVVTGLTNGTAYNFRVRAVKAYVGPLSAASSTVTPATVPDPPVLGALTSGAAGGLLTVVVNWTPPAFNGGTAITGWSVSAYDSVGTLVQRVTVNGAGARSRTVTFAAPGGSFKFDVAAINPVGTGIPSAQSGLVLAQ
jgi:Ca2+-binding RTX toxin-like protein